MYTYVVDCFSLSLSHLDVELFVTFFNSFLTHSRSLARSLVFAHSRRGVFCLYPPPISLCLRLVVGWFGCPSTTLSALFCPPKRADYRATVSDGERRLCVGVHVLYVYVCKYGRCGGHTSFLCCPLSPPLLLSLSTLRVEIAVHLHLSCITLSFVCACIIHRRWISTFIWSLSLSMSMLIHVTGHMLPVIVCRCVRGYLLTVRRTLP